MITPTKVLKIYGILMLYFAILDCAYILMDVMDNSYLLGDHSTAVDIFSLIILALGVLITLAKFWLGRQALCYAKGIGKGTSHILLIKIGIAFGILVLVNDIVEVFIGTGPYREVISSIVCLIVMYSYYKAAKACL